MKVNALILLRPLFTLLFCLAFCYHVIAQDGRSHSLQSAFLNASEVRSLVLNLNDTTIAPDLVGIELLVNLEELIVFGVEDAIHGPEKLKWLSREEAILVPVDDFYQARLDTITSTIKGCRSLRYIRLNSAGVTDLPLSDHQFKHIEELHIANTKIKGDVLVKMVPKFRNIRVLNVFGCKITSSELAKIRLELPPECLLIYSYEDWYNYSRQHGVQHYVVLKDNSIIFESEYVAFQFIESLPVWITSDSSATYGFKYIDYFKKY